MVLSKDLLPWYHGMMIPNDDLSGTECQGTWNIMNFIDVPEPSKIASKLVEVRKLGGDISFFIQFLWRYLEGLWFFTVALRHRLPVGALARALTALAKAEKFLEQKIGLENRVKIWRKPKKLIVTVHFQIMKSCAWYICFEMSISKSWKSWKKSKGVS